MKEQHVFDMPIGEAMETQRAIRRLKADPVDDGLVLRLIELALKAPTGKNAQKALPHTVEPRRMSGAYPGYVAHFTPPP